MDLNIGNKKILALGIVGNKKILTLGIVGLIFIIAGMLFFYIEVKSWNEKCKGVDMSNLQTANIECVKVLRTAFITSIIASSLFGAGILMFILSIVFYFQEGREKSL